MDKHLFQLMFTAKQLQKLSKKCEKEEKQEKEKLKKALQQGNIEGAKIYASNAIRKKNEALTNLKLSSRVDAVASRLKTATTMRNLTNSIGSVVVNMERAMKSMNLEQMSQIMDKFETVFEDMDVRTSYMENGMDRTTTLMTPQDQVDELIHQVADENGLELQMSMPGAVSGILSQGAMEKEDLELTKRLAQLRNA